MIWSENVRGPVARTACCEPLAARRIPAAHPLGSFKALQPLRAVHMDRGAAAGRTSYLVAGRGEDHKMWWSGSKRCAQRLEMVAG